MKPFLTTDNTDNTDKPPYGRGGRGLFGKLSVTPLDQLAT